MVMVMGMVMVVRAARLYRRGNAGQLHDVPAPNGDPCQGLPKPNARVDDSGTCTGSTSAKAQINAVTVK
jgi:hypothetical protein